MTKMKFDKARVEKKVVAYWHKDSELGQDYMDEVLYHIEQNWNENATGDYDERTLELIENAHSIMALNSGEDD